MRMSHWFEYEATAGQAGKQDGIGCVLPAGARIGAVSSSAAASRNGRSEEATTAESHYV